MSETSTRAPGWRKVVESKVVVVAHFVLLASKIEKLEEFIAGVAFMHVGVNKADQI